MLDNLPDDVFTKAQQLHKKGYELFIAGEMEAARIHFFAAFQLAPNHASVCQNLGAVLRNLGKYKAALYFAKRSLALQPDNMFVKTNLAIAYLDLRDYTSAVEILEEVILYHKDKPEAWHNYGLARYYLGHLNDALEAFEKSLELNPKPVQVQSDKALTLLALGRIQEGLEVYEIRWELLNKNFIFNSNIPMYKGEDIADKEILIHHEQGFGDSIMLSRFLPIFQQKTKAKITVAVPDELIRLFETNFPTIKVVALSDEKLLVNEDNYAYHLPMLSILRYVGVNSPQDISSKPYLKANTDLDFIPLDPTKINIGMVWASGDHGPRLAYRRRVIDIEDFFTLASIPNIELFSLQKGAEHQDIYANGMEGIVYNLNHKINDFADTAAIIAKLDIVISVDSAVAHLAGAMGKRCYMLSPFTSCWRWWGVDTGKPWYENMTIAYQQDNGDWSEAIDKIAYDINLIHNRGF